MDFRILEAVRDRLRADRAIADYFALHFPTATLFFAIGLKPNTEKGIGMPEDRFPYIAVSPLSGTTQTRPPRDDEAQVSVTWGVIEDRFEDGAYLGVRHVLAVERLVIEALTPQPIIKPEPGRPQAWIWDGIASGVQDPGIFHPFYEADLTLKLNSRRV
jgi:hypothetical protein